MPFAVSPTQNPLAALAANKARLANGSANAGAAAPAKGPLFSYPARPLANLGAAVAWRPGQPGMSGTQANLRVTDTYQALDVAMTAYLGEPQLPNWMTFGKYASREVGVQVIRLEELMKVADAHDPDAAIDTLKDFMSDPAKLGGQGVALLKVSFGNPLLAVKNAATIRDALVAGNTGVYADIAPAYDVFLKAEANGQDGVAALRAAGWGQAPKDSQGLLLDAFTIYQRTVREKATLTPQERKDLIGRATLLIGNHEQMVVLQGPRMFGNPRVAKLLSSLSSLLTVTDARGTERLLPHGGNWSDFATRMGYDEVPADAPGAMRVFDHQGVEHHFAPSSNPRRWQGTIGEYFTSGLEPAAARAIIAGVPAPLPPAYDSVSNVERGKAWLREHVLKPFGKGQAAAAPASA